MGAVALRRAVLVSVVSVAVPGALFVVHADETCPFAGQVRTRGDGWVEVRGPDFGDGDTAADIRVAAFTPADLTFGYVSNELSVMRTRDGGCTWEAVYRTAELVQLPQLGVAEISNKILDVEVPASGRGLSWLYLLTEQNIGGVHRTTVLSSNDGGSTLTTGVGLPPAGAALAIAAAPSEPARAYVAIGAASTAAGPGAAIYATDDGGRTWARTTDLSETFEATGLAVDPVDEEHVYAWNPRGLYQSRDGGTTFAKTDGIAAAVNDVALAAGNAGGTVLVSHAHSALVDVSRDGGRTWRTFASPDVVDAVAAAPFTDTIAVSGGSTVSVVFDKRGRREVSPEGDVPLDLTLSLPDGEGVTLLGRLPRSLVRRTVDFPRPKERLIPVDIGTPVDVVLGSASLEPEQADLTIPAGEKRTLPYTLRIPPVPTPLDVFFLVDTTGSMGGAINGLRAGIGTIVRDLAESGIDARFGLGDLRDYPVGSYGSTTDWVYKRHREIGPADADLEAAIEALQAGGGGDGPEAQLPALYQAVTGSGDLLGRVPPGMAAKFRDDAVRVIVLATDTSFHSGAPYPGQTYDTVIQALKRHDTHVVGLAISNGGRVDLDHVAEDTNTLAPPTGVDCDGDRRPDLQANEPMVCPIFSVPVPIDIDNGVEMPIAEAIVSLLRSVRDVVPVEFVSDTPSVARVVQPAKSRTFDVKRANVARYTVEVTCGRSPEETLHDVTFTATRPGRLLGTATLSVRCLAEPVPPPPPPPAAVPPPHVVHQAVGAAAPAPPPLEPVANPQPNINPNPNPNPNPQAVPQAGLAPQADEQHSVALAYADPVGQSEPGLAMVGLQPDDAARYVLALGMAASCAAGYAVARRRREALVPVRARAGVRHNRRRA